MHNWCIVSIKVVGDAIWHVGSSCAQGCAAGSPQTSEGACAQHNVSIHLSWVLHDEATYDSALCAVSSS